MKIFSAEQIKNWDQFTIAQEPITSINLMERAAANCVQWLQQKILTDQPVIIFCGKGNNGGDGLAIARMLLQSGYTVTIYILEFGHIGSEDFQTNLKRLHTVQHADIRFIQTEEQFHDFAGNELIIDALFGSGLNRTPDGITALLIEHINQSGCKIISIDVPSGMSVDSSSAKNIIVKADHTLTFQCMKLCFLLPENASYTGAVQVMDIGLHTEFYEKQKAKYELTDVAIIKSIYKPRQSFAHKGTYGHSLLFAGSYGKLGAAVLAAKACLRSGTGLLSCHIPQGGYTVLQTALPEAMVMTDYNSSFITKFEGDISIYKTIGVGPGIGTAAETRNFLKELLDLTTQPIVLDADALNILGMEKELLNKIPAGSVLTPHPKEFERLFGKTENDIERIELAIEKAKALHCVIVLKGHHTFIATPPGNGYFNNTGNAGMAKGGSGDVLTGIITALLAQGYDNVQAAILGVWLHGLAADIAAEELSQEAMLATDIIEHLGKAFLTIQHYS